MNDVLASFHHDDGSDDATPSTSFAQARALLTFGGLAEPDAVDNDMSDRAVFHTFFAALCARGRAAQADANLVLTKQGRGTAAVLALAQVLQEAARPLPLEAFARFAERRLLHCWIRDAVVSPFCSDLRTHERSLLVHHAPCARRQRTHEASEDLDVLCAAAVRILFTVRRRGAHDPFRVMLALVVLDGVARVATSQYVYRAVRDHMLNVERLRDIHTLRQRILHVVTDLCAHTLCSEGATAAPPLLLHAARHVFVMLATFLRTTLRYVDARGLFSPFLELTQTHPWLLPSTLTLLPNHVRVLMLTSYEPAALTTVLLRSLRFLDSFGAWCTLLHDGLLTALPRGMPAVESCLDALAIHVAETLRRHHANTGEHDHDGKKHQDRDHDNDDEDEEEDWSFALTLAATLLLGSNRKTDGALARRQPRAYGVMAAFVQNRGLQRFGERLERHGCLRFVSFALAVPPRAKQRARTTHRISSSS